MNVIRKRAYSRAGLIGNPSDGYNGKTISLIVRNFCAEVVLYEWDSLDIVLAENDRARFASIHDLARDVKLHGYYGGIRLVKARPGGASAPESRNRRCRRGYPRPARPRAPAPTCNGWPASRPR